MTPEKALFYAGFSEYKATWKNLQKSASVQRIKDSKSVREQSPASSNLAVSAKDNRNLRIAVVFFCYELIFTTVCDIINLISELIYFQHLFFIGRDYKIGRENLDRLLDIREPMKILILM